MPYCTFYLIYFLYEKKTQEKCLYILLLQNLKVAE